MITVTSELFKHPRCTINCRNLISWAPPGHVLYRLVIKTFFLFCKQTEMYFRLFAEKIFNGLYSCGMKCKFREVIIYFFKAVYSWYYNYLFPQYFRRSIFDTRYSPYDDQVTHN